MKIDWAYMRKGWTSCKKAWEAFTDAKIDIAEEIDAKKNIIGKNDVWAVLRKAENVYVASGQKTIRYKPDSTNKEELINKATGRTGNLRAPTLCRGENLYVGFNVSMYEGLMSS